MKTAKYNTILYIKPIDISLNSIKTIFTKYSFYNIEILI